MGKFTRWVLAASAVIVTGASASATSILDIPVVGTAFLAPGPIDVHVGGDDFMAAGSSETTRNLGICTGTGPCDISQSFNIMASPFAAEHLSAASSFGSMKADFTTILLQFTGNTSLPNQTGPFTFSAPVTVNGTVQGFQSVPGTQQGPNLFTFSISGKGTVMGTGVPLGNGSVALPSGSFSFMGDAKLTGGAAATGAESSAVPEPSTLLLMTGGGLALMLAKRFAIAR